MTRALLKFFAFADLLSIGFMSKSTWELITNLSYIPHEFLSLTNAIATLILFFTLFITAISFYFNEKLAYITYYIQFPMRIMVWVFTIGFITFMPEIFNLSDSWFDALFKICFVVEVFRLYFTIKAHKSLT